MIKKHGLAFAKKAADALRWKVMAKVALGKGLSALIQPKIAAPVPSVELGERVQTISLGEIVPSSFQPRREFREDHLKELIDSIRERGIIQPLIVRKNEGKFELIAGERRWRAAQVVGLKDAPVIIREASDREVLELALIENLQREDLNPIEEAFAYQRLTKDFSLTQEEVSHRVGKSRAAIANCMRLLDLDQEVQGWLVQGRISVGHAKVLLSIKSPEEQRMLADQIIRQGASVRMAEKLTEQHQEKVGKTPSNRRKSSKIGDLSPALTHIQNLLQHRLSTRVVLHHGEKTGTISIDYYGNDDLQRILSELGIKSD
ncbi:MAG: ParB/RepB/Spo0J family partition protein [Chthoniobacterales bacterium]